VLREHFRCQRELYGDFVACRVIRRVVHWFVKGSSGAAQLRERGNHIETPEQFEELVAVYAHSHPVMPADAPLGYPR